MNVNGKKKKIKFDKNAKLTFFRKKGRFRPQPKQKSLQAVRYIQTLAGLLKNTGAGQGSGEETRKQ